MTQRDRSRRDDHTKRSRSSGRLRASVFTLALGASASIVLASSGAVADQHQIERSKAPDGAVVYIISPANGEHVKSPVTVKFGLTGMGVAPAGVQMEKTGHHHLIIDAEQPRPDVPMPADDKHRHFGAGQTETTIELEPGVHSLQLVLGDYLHVPHDPPVVSERILITVVK